MHFLVKMRADNAAFDDDPFYEVVRILRLLADRIEHEGGARYALMDSNGNKVGEARFVR